MGGGGLFYFLFFFGLVDDPSYTFENVFNTQINLFVHRDNMCTARKHLNRYNRFKN